MLISDLFCFYCRLKLPVFAIKKKPVIFQVRVYMKVSQYVHTYYEEECQ